MTNYDTYAPAVTWFAIRLLIVFSILFSWLLQQVDFVMTYPQAPIEMDMYMEFPQGFNIKNGNSKNHHQKSNHVPYYLFIMIIHLGNMYYGVADTFLT